MENNYRRAAAPGGAGEGAVDTRDQLQSESPEGTVNDITETFMRTIQEEIERLTLLFKEKIRTARQMSLQQRRHEASGKAPCSICEPQRVMDRQKQLYDQSQREIKETSTNSTAETRDVNGDEWQEESYQKLKQMKEMYFSDIKEIYQRMVARLQQFVSPTQLNSEQFEKLKSYKLLMEQIMLMLEISKSNIPPGLNREKLCSYEKQIIKFININKPTKPMNNMSSTSSAPPESQSINDGRDTDE